MVKGTGGLISKFIKGHIHFCQTPSENYFVLIPVLPFLLDCDKRFPCFIELNGAFRARQLHVVGEWIAIWIAVLKIFNYLYLVNGERLWVVLKQGGTYRHCSLLLEILVRGKEVPAAVGENAWRGGNKEKD